MDRRAGKLGYSPEEQKKVFASPSVFEKVGGYAKDTYDRLSERTKEWFTRAISSNRAKRPVEMASDKLPVGALLEVVEINPKELYERDERRLKSPIDAKKDELFRLSQRLFELEHRHENASPTAIASLKKMIAKKREDLIKKQQEYAHQIGPEMTAIQGKREEFDRVRQVVGSRVLERLTDKAHIVEQRVKHLRDRFQNAESDLISSSRRTGIHMQRLGGELSNTSTHIESANRRGQEHPLADERMDQIREEMKNYKAQHDHVQDRLRKTYGILEKKTDRLTKTQRTMSYIRHILLGRRDAVSRDYEISNNIASATNFATLRRALDDMYIEDPWFLGEKYYREDDYRDLVELMGRFIVGDKKINKKTNLRQTITIGEFPMSVRKKLNQLQRAI